MAKMILTITLRRDVPDQETGEFILNLVRERLQDHPEVDIKGHVTNHFNDEE